MTTLLHRVLHAGPDFPFAVLRRHGSDTVDLYTGEVVDVESLADIPLGSAGDDHQPEVLTLVPYRQVRERGFAAMDDGAPLRCLVVSERETVTLDEMLERLPADAVPLVDGGFDVSDEDYASIVRRVIEDEIGRGEGANFVIRREFTATTEVPAERAVLAWLRALLSGETGAYWTFAVHTPE
jgi:phenazine biosynthesis protein phzE